MKQVTCLIIGAGSRGFTYAGYAKQHPDLMKVVGVAEPRDYYREAMAKEHGIAPSRVFRDWSDAAAVPRFADAVIISTIDSVHKEPAVAFAKLGYNMLLEKPLAPTEPDCRAIVDAVVKSGVIFSICHVLRYTTYTQALKKIIGEGRIGDIVAIQHLEPVSYWHIAHSFVRGNWRNTKLSSPMLLAKSCHDLDWLRYIMGVPCLKVSSFGTRKHFRKENQPAGAADRCLDCRVEPTCPYSAKKIYLGRIARGFKHWPVDMLTPDLTVEGVTKALKAGPYGRCVYACDNDVVDNQVVNMLFEGDRTASFSMVGFNDGGNRRTRIFGTRGSIVSDGRIIEIFDFLTDKRETVTPAEGSSALEGHGGGDYYLMKYFIEAVSTGDRGKILSGAEESLETHRMVFAAEEARLGNRVVEV